MDSQLYDELYRVEQDHWWFCARRHIVWSLVRRYLGARGWGLGTGDPELLDSPQPPAPSPRLRICELGCGTGGNLAAVADLHDVIGVECSPRALDYARRRLGSRVIAGRLPDDVDLPQGSFDVVLLTDVLEHIEDDAASARTALRLVRPGGIIVATVPAYQWLYSPRDAAHHHFRRYGKRQFRALWTGSDAEILLLSHYNTLLFPFAAAARLASKLRPVAGLFEAGRRANPGSKTPATGGDLTILPAPLNRLLAGVMRSESHALGKLAMPFGLSLVAVVRKRGVGGCRRAA